MLCLFIFIHCFLYVTSVKNSLKYFAAIFLAIISTLQSNENTRIVFLLSVYNYSSICNLTFLHKLCQTKKAYITAGSFSSICLKSEFRVMASHLPFSQSNDHSVWFLNPLFFPLFFHCFDITNNNIKNFFYSIRTLRRYKTYL